MFVFLSNYFNVLTPQVTGFVIEFVQRALNLPGNAASSRNADYDGLVEKFIKSVEKMDSVTKVVALCGITILVLALLRGFLLFLMRQTIIVMSRHIEYDQKNEIYSHYQQLDTAFYKKNSTGDLILTATPPIVNVQELYQGRVVYP